MARIVAAREPRRQRRRLAKRLHLSQVGILSKWDRSLSQAEMIRVPRSPKLHRCESQNIFRKSLSCREIHFVNAAEFFSWHSPCFLGEPSPAHGSKSGRILNESLPRNPSSREDRAMKAIVSYSSFFAAVL